jgi:orotate phosphoribosyltransferase
MSSLEQQLLQVIEDRAFQRGKFRLASGAESDYYIDGKMVEVHSRAAFLIGQVIYERTKHLEFDAIGGLEAGAIPLTTAAVIHYHLNGREMEGFWVRDTVKTHGTKKLLEGKIKAGDRVVIVDDVITKGGSALKAVNAVREMGCEVVLVLALVDRLQGGAQLFRQEGIECYESIFTVRDLGVEVDVPAETSAVTH